MSLLCAARCRADQPREAAPGYRLCWTCKDWMARNLTDLADLAPDLEDALTRPAMGVGEKVSGSPTRGLELNDLAAKVRWQIHHDMVTTVRLVVEERGWHTYPADAIAPMALWLRNQVDWLAAHPSAGERADEASSWPGRARNAIHPNPAKRVTIGPCVSVDCAGVLTAIVKPQDSLLPSTIVCSWWIGLTEERRAALAEEGTEPHAWRADQWHALGRRMQPA